MRLNGELGGRFGLFAWLTRNGMGPAFGSRPIGPYQLHQCHAIDALQHIFGEGADIRVRKGMVTSLSSRAGITTSLVYKVADRRRYVDGQGWEPIRETLRREGALLP